MMKSVNGRILCEPYTGSKALQSQVSSGFATVKQKSGLIGLKVIADAKLSDGTEVKAGQTAYFSEEMLSITQWPFHHMNCKDIPTPFVIAPCEQVVCVK